MLQFRAHRDNYNIAISRGGFVGKLFDGKDFIEFIGSGFYKIEPWFNARTPILKFRVYFDLRDYKDLIGGLKDFDSYHDAIFFANDMNDKYIQIMKT